MYHVEIKFKIQNVVCLDGILLCINVAVPFTSTYEFTVILIHF